MVRHLEGKLQSNYRVGSVYVERHTIWGEVTTENRVSTPLVKTPLSLLSSCGMGSERDYSQEHFEVIERRL